MSLNYEMAKYTELTGEDGTKVSISRLGGYLDGYEKGRADERERTVKELETLRDEVWQDTDSGERIVRSNAWDKVDLMDKAIETVRGGKNEN